MTLKEMQKRLKELQDANERAPSWGAAVGARLEEIKQLEAAIRYATSNNQPNN